MSDGKAPSESRALVAVSVQTVLSIASFFVGKEALHSIPAGPLVLVRSSGAALLLVVILFAARGKNETKLTRSDWRQLFFLGVVGVPLNQGLFLAGLALTSAAHAALLYALTPALVLLIGVRRGVERFSRGRVVGIALAIAGVAIVLVDAALRTPAAVAPGTASAAHQAAGSNPLAGDLMVLGAVVCWALYTALSRDVIARIGAMRATVGALGIGACVYIPIGLVSWWWIGFSFDHLPASAWGSVAWLIVMSSVVSYFCWYYAIRRLDPSRVAVFINLQPIGTALAQWALFSLPLGPAFLAGGALVVAGVITAQRARAPG